MKPLRTTIACLLLCTGLLGCGSWTGGGFQPEGPELPRLRDVLAIGPGRIVADVGTGRGQLAVALATEVGPDGHVFATDLVADRVERLRSAVAAARLRNVTVIQSTERETGLPAECCDLIVLRRVYHHLSQPPAVIASLHRALKANGRLAIIDFPPPFFLPRGDAGVSPLEVINEVAAGGFELARRLDDWPGRGPMGSYLLLFRKH